MLWLNNIREYESSETVEMSWCRRCYRRSVTLVVLLEWTCLRALLHLRLVASVLTTWHDGRCSITCVQTHLTLSRMFLFFSGMLFVFWNKENRLVQLSSRGIHTWKFINSIGSIFHNQYNNKITVITIKNE